MADTWKADLARIEQFLREWNPIGIGDELSPGGTAHDEYDSYAPAAFSKRMSRLIEREVEKFATRQLNLRGGRSSRFRND